MTIIDELKELSGYLNDLESELMMFFKTSVDLLVVFDADGAICKISPSCIKTLGYTPEELVRQSYANLVSNDDRAAFQESIEYIRTSSLPKIILKTRTKYGEFRLISWAISKLISGKCYAIGRDVTDVYKKYADLEAEVMLKAQTSIKNE